MPKKATDNATLSEEQIKAVAEIAAAAAIQEYKAEAEREKQERKDKRLYNTRLLLERYRGMIKYSEKAIYDAIQLDEDMELQTLLEMMGAKGDITTLSVESIQTRVAQTRVILSHVNKMLDFYQYRCTSSGKSEVLRKWQTIDHLFISDDEKTVEELAEEFNVDDRTVYRYIKSAIQDLSALFFGYIE